MVPARQALPLPFLHLCPFPLSHSCVSVHLCAGPCSNGGQSCFLIAANWHSFSSVHINLVAFPKIYAFHSRYMLSKASCYSRSLTRLCPLTFFSLENTANQWASTSSPPLTPHWSLDTPGSLCTIHWWTGFPTRWSAGDLTATTTASPVPNIPLGFLWLYYLPKTQISPQSPQFNTIWERFSVKPELCSYLHAIPRIVSFTSSLGFPYHPAGSIICPGQRGRQWKHTPMTPWLLASFLLLHTILELGSSLYKRRLDPCAPYQLPLL